MRADQAGAELGSDLCQPFVRAAPAVVDQVGAGLAGRPAGLVPPGIDADQDLRVTGTDRADEASRPPDLLGRVDVSAGSSRDAADVHDVGTLRDHLVHPIHRR